MKNKTTDWMRTYAKAFGEGDEKTCMAMVQEKRDDLAHRLWEAKKRVKANKAANGGVYIPDEEARVYFDSLKK